MSDTLKRITELVEAGVIRVSDHGYDELSADAIPVRDVVRGIKKARLVEDYPEYPKGPCVLVLEKDRMGEAVHVVWGIPKGEDQPAVLVTAYRPDPQRWTDSFMRRRQ